MRHAEQLDSTRGCRRGLFESRSEARCVRLARSSSAAALSGQAGAYCRPAICAVCEQAFERNGKDRAEGAYADTEEGDGECEEVEERAIAGGRDFSRRRIRV